MKKVVALILALSMALALCGCGNSTKKDYDKAVALFADGAYKDAQAIFEGLGDYEDSTDYVKKCKAFIANEYFDEGELESALAIYKEIGDEFHIKEVQRKIYLNHRKELAADYAEKLFTACAKGFSNPLSINLIGVWYYGASDKINADKYASGEEITYGEDIAAFTYQFEIQANNGETLTVYYGINGRMVEDDISLISQMFVMGSNNSPFKKDEITARQNGVELDAAAIQEYFIKNYK